jgi:hypothetical protein
MLGRGSSKLVFWFAAAAAILVVASLISTPARAQVAGATLSGTVTDPAQAAIANAQVTITNTATGVSRQVQTDSAGFYSAPNLLPGPYEVTVSAAGFNTVKMPPVELVVGAEQTMNVSMTVGSTSQTVEVSGSAPIIDLTSTAISATVSENTVVELPLNGRDWTQLATLQPSVTTVLTQQPNGVNANRGNRGFGNELTISGTRPQLNNYRVDGISVIDYASGGPGSVLGYALGVDAVEEFSVLTSNYSAEYGRTTGGVVNAITRSGANAFHGTAFVFLRDSKWDARNAFDPPHIAPFHRANYGGSVGGPIFKDKTFFFVNYEGLGESLGITSPTLKVPSPTMRQGDLWYSGSVNPYASDCTTIAPNECQVHDTLAPFTPGVVIPAQILNLWPAPPNAVLQPIVTVGGIPQGNIMTYTITSSQPGNEHFGTARVDHKFSDKDSIASTFYYDTANNASPDAIDDVINGNSSTQVFVQGEETHSFTNSLVNSLRGGFHRTFTVTNQGLTAVNPVAAISSLGAFPTSLGAPGMVVPGLTTLNGGIGGLASPHHTWNSFQVYDDAFLTRGSHSIKFGFAAERMQHNLSIINRPDGSFNSGGLDLFLTSQFTGFSGQNPAQSNSISARQTLFAGYVQDDWKFRKNLTINMGLRYEMVTVPTEANNPERLTVLPTFSSSTPHLGSPYFNNPTKRDFEPRVGLAWDPFGDGKTSVRAAFGIFDALPMNYEFFLGEVFSYPFNFVTATSSIPVDTFPTAPAGITTNYQAFSVEQNPHRNYVMIWNMNVQRQLNSTTSVTVGYVGNHGVHMLDRADDVNAVIPSQLSDGRYLYPFGGSGTKINTSFGDIRGLYWDGDSEYDALEVNVQKRLSHHFQVQGAYTWGKSIDEGSASVIGDPFTNSISSLPWFCKLCRRGLSDFNIGQSLSINYIWEVPGPHNMGAVASRILDGWQVGGIVTVQSGVPITPLIGGDPNGSKSSDAYAYPDRLTGPGCTGNPVNPGSINYVKLNCFTVPMAGTLTSSQCTPFPAVAGSCMELLGNAGRNSIVGPGLFDWDFSLFKNNYIRRISETFNFQLRAELFNVFNHTNFDTPFDNEVLFQANGSPAGGAGQLDRTSTTSRQMQFAAKIIF